MDRVTRWTGSPPGGDRHDPATMKLAAPIPRPPKIICIGLNYRDHAEESNMPIPGDPDGLRQVPDRRDRPRRSRLCCRRASAKPDYEAEFAVVIGKRGRHIPEDRWRDHVFGYTILNDVSARDFQMATSQWMIGKTFDTFCPFGPGDRHRRRDRRPAQSRHLARAERRDAAELEHQQSDLHRPATDRVPLERVHARARRHHRHRHPRRRRLRPQAASVFDEPATNAASASRAWASCTIP